MKSICIGIIVYVSGTGSLESIKCIIDRGTLYVCTCSDMKGTLIRISLHERVISSQESSWASERFNSVKSKAVKSDFQFCLSQLHRQERVEPRASGVARRVNFKQILGIFV